eukprot:PITA_18143
MRNAVNIYSSIAPSPNTSSIKLSTLRLLRENFDQLTTLNRNWEKGYPHARKGKAIITRIWRCIPSALCWQIWLSRNNSIFKNQKPDPNLTLAKTMGLVAEMISANTQSQVKKKKWKLRGTQNEIEQWIQDQKTFTLQFDGASKNNHGQAGAGGIISDQNGQVITTYEWGLGNMKNNMAEAYSLLLGTCILKNLQAKNLAIIGDSAIMIAAMESGGEFKNQALNRIKHRILENSKQLGIIQFKHAMRNYNTKAHSLANSAVTRPIG